MDIEKLEKIIKLFLDDLSKVHGKRDLYFEPFLYAELTNIIRISIKLFPDYQEFFRTADLHTTSFDAENARKLLNYINEIIKIEKVSETKIKEAKLFDSADEKLKQASLSFQNNDYSSTFHNLNTALELILKDKLDIPVTITKINTSRIIDIWVSNKIELYSYLREVKKRVVMIDNKVKHQGYSPSKIESINAIKAIEELVFKLRDKEIKLTDDVRKTIYGVI